ncbi:putative UPF0157 protein YqkA [Mollisia scopiformis]|uniref:Putative UPF0157 protein YqkA n=1 Tax=Mollisia scopiformis TaxID=149040 RepID=A0A194XEG4_MOLSC|nr:putative UPF0157 protein YqkA [Mollisia scopiformis]KUJ18580.1 putative UPF0157 protein YqkA [Mollisia scopiformis]
MERPWWEPLPIALEPHNPSWATEFNTAAQMLRTLLSGLPITSIEHIGSTAIPDLLAKPILDIDIVISGPDFPAILQRMKEGGYTHLGECHLPGRHAFWQPGANAKTGEPTRWVEVEGVGSVRERRRNTYVCFERSLSLRNHRDLKRVLMEDEELRKEYGERKSYLVHTLLIDDVEEYCFGKNAVVQKILKKAGWSDEDLAVVCKTGWYRV